MRSTKLHYYPTPGQTMFRIQDHAARVQALGKQFITDKQRAAALQVIWSAYFEVAQIDSLQERRDPQAPVPAGDGQHLWRLSRDTGCYVAQPVRDADSYQRPGLDHYGRMPMQNEDDDRYGMRDPVLELSRYTINPRIIHLTQREDARFELNNQRWIMDNLRGLERRLWPKNVNRTARETITLRST